MMYRPARQEGNERRKTWREMRARQPLICIMERCIVIVSHSFYRSPGFLDPADVVVVVLPSTARKELFSWRLRGIASRVACLDLGGSMIQRIGMYVCLFRWKSKWWIGWMKKYWCVFDCVCFWYLRGWHLLWMNLSKLWYMGLGIDGKLGKIEVGKW